MKCNINSEYEKLRVVIVHEPGNEIERLAPSNMNQLLFEDIPYLKKMIKEHKGFVRLLKRNGVKPLEFKELLMEILKDDGVKEKLIDKCIELEGCYGMKNKRFLSCLEPEEIAEVFFSGITYNESNRKPIERMTRVLRMFLISPLPNSYYTRDSNAIIRYGIVPCRMKYLVRDREALFMKFIFKFHPFFRKKAIFCYREKKEETMLHTIEGGDIIVLNRSTVLIGNSGRTESYAIEKLAGNLFEHDIVDTVYEVKIPPRSIYGHLDSVFSIISEDIILFYPDVFHEDFEIGLYRPSLIHGKIVAKKEARICKLKEVLSDNLGNDIIPLKTGGGDIHYSEREQFTADGTNILAISPKRVISYIRNEKTNQELEDYGVKVITIEGSELVRGRGGPRSMIMPVIRG